MISENYEMATIKVLMKMFYTKYHCQSLFLKMGVIFSALDKDLEAKATGFSVLLSWYWDRTAPTP